MSELTDEQVEFWEWCGFRRVGKNWAWLSHRPYYHNLPPIDLNNLFRYGVLKAIAYLATQPIGCYSIVAIYEWLFARWVEELRNEGDPTQALYTVLQKVRDSYGNGK